jgi:hypothetical protein
MANTAKEAWAKLTIFITPNINAKPTAKTAYEMPTNTPDMII